MNLTSADSMMLHAKTAEEENFNWVADQIKAYGTQKKKINYLFGPLAKISTAKFFQDGNCPGNRPKENYCVEAILAVSLVLA